MEDGIPRHLSEGMLNQCFPVASICHQATNSLAPQKLSHSVSERNLIALPLLDNNKGSKTHDASHKSKKQLVQKKCKVSPLTWLHILWNLLLHLMGLLWVVEHLLTQELYFSLTPREIRIKNLPTLQSQYPPESHCSAKRRMTRKSTLCFEPIRALLWNPQLATIICSSRLRMGLPSRRWLLMFQRHQILAQLIPNLWHQKHPSKP